MAVSNHDDQSALLQTLDNMDYIPQMVHRLSDGEGIPFAATQREASQEAESKSATDGDEMPFLLA